MTPAPAPGPASTPGPARRSEHPVVACWGGADSSGAVQLGGLLAGALGQPLELVAAYRYESLALSSRMTPPAEEEARYEAARAGVGRARRLVPPDVEVRERVVPAEGIATAVDDLARDVDACLLVLGRDLSGHVTRAVIGRASCPVAVAPLSLPLPGESPPRRIGVACDDSPPSSLAAVAAEHLARATGGAVATHTVGPADGDPGAALVRESDGLDLLLCGSHGKGRVRAAVLGSVSSHLVAAAHCPVIVVGPGIRSRDDRPLGLSTAGER